MLKQSDTNSGRKSAGTRLALIAQAEFGPIVTCRVAAPAKAGAIAPLDVVLPAQNTGLGPEKTSFFQALAIPTKITKGTIEILNDIKLITCSDKVGASEATLLNMLKIFPFSYGLVIQQVYDSGTVFDPSVLDITNDDLRNRFLQGVANIASVCLAIGYPTIASVPHTIINGFKNVLAIAVETDITFKEAEMMKEYLKDPSKFAVAAPAGGGGGAAAKEVAKKEEEPEEEEDDDMGFGLFD
ncbi:60S acidic ribosomal protein P0 [Lamellibrachia satsuma]|nr:60S acidic ribosomal protein P0 [Lamellibrachia satsuma]